MANLKTRLLVVLVLAYCLIALPSSAQEQADWSGKVIPVRDLDKKERAVCSAGSKGVPAETLAKLIARERHGPAVVAAAGMYFEGGGLDKNAPELIRQLAKRPDIGSQALAYAALSSQATDLIVGFASSKSKTDQQVAARMLAATAVMRRDSDREAKRSAEQMRGNKGSKLNVDYSTQIEQLLNATKDDVALEYLLLTVGLDRAAVSKDTIIPHVKTREQGVAMAAQYALAAIQQPVDEAALLKAIARSPKRRASLPALSYNPRQTPRTYAIMAAGEAKLQSARDPLFKLITDKDLHTAVYAARALGQIGGEGLAAQLIGAMDENTPWPVLVAMYDALGVYPEKAAVELLRERYREETGRFRQDVLYALLSVVSGQPDGMTIEAFDAWWQTNGEAFTVDPKATRTWRSENKIGTVQVSPVAGFYESAVISERPVFSVDASISMKGAQIESLKQTLSDVVVSLPERVKFNIIDFGGHIRTLAPGGMIPAKNRKQAMYEFVHDMDLTGGTRSYDAIERAMNIPGMDTVHYLSDGQPYGSHLKSWRRIEYVTNLYCSVAPVAVHVIFFPNPGQKVKVDGNTGMMKRYAEAHAGNFHVIQVDAAPAN